MRRMFAVVTLFVASVFGGHGQSPVEPGAVMPNQEPENRDLVVERLMRYHDSGEYDREIRQVVNSARDFLLLEVKNAPKDEKLAAVFDIDETALSNWEAISGCGFCSYSARLKLFPSLQDPAIVPVLELYNLAKSRGVAVFFITGRQEAQRASTIANLNGAGYTGWSDLIMQPDGASLPARQFKSTDRQSIAQKGYRIVLNIGDQASDLAGCCSEHIFKLPNPFYLVN